MRKGEARRQAILETAERLFFTRGYENTSIQDILSEMQLSKGGFYHHFESKQQLLEEICLKRAESACGKGVAETGATNDPVKKLNALFLRGGIFSDESLKYISMMLQCANGGEVFALRDQIRTTTLDKYLSLLTSILIEGMEKHVFYMRMPQAVARLVILLSCDMNDEIVGIAAKPELSHEDIENMTDLLNTYRRSVELMIGAPYASVILVDMKRVVDVLKSLRILAAH